MSAETIPSAPGPSMSLTGRAHKQFFVEVPHLHDVYKDRSFVTITTECIIRSSHKEDEEEDVKEEEEEGEDGSQSTQKITIPMVKIPCIDIGYYTTRPYKWLRMICFHILGLTGSLQSTDGKDIDYEATSVSHRSLQYICDGTFLLSLVKTDALPEPAATAFPNTLAKTRSVPGSQVTSRDGDFAKELRRRDGPYCPFTGFSAANCNTCHFIPHAKGDKIIYRWTAQRVKLMQSCGNTSHGHDDTDIISDINDTRNGMWLSGTFNCTFNAYKPESDAMHCAILVTPNFGFITTDLPPPAEARSIKLNQTNLQVRQERVEEGADVYTFHLFPATSSNEPIKNNTDSSRKYDAFDEKPSKLILDAIYGAAVLTQYGDEDFKSLLEDASSWLPPPPVRTPEPRSDAAHSDSDDQDDGGSTYMDEDDTDTRPNRTEPIQLRKRDKEDQDAGGSRAGGSGGGQGVRGLRVCRSRAVWAGKKRALSRCLRVVWAVLALDVSRRVQEDTGSRRLEEWAARVHTGVNSTPVRISV
ncbi:hypothetical protein C8J57DRAFT_1563274 [Mycena rebaudengoi]|nr:hypothetical protein C8J57DRAFT_1563274 [Mycena rebaudengoi]